MQSWSKFQLLESSTGRMKEDFKINERWEPPMNLMFHRNSTATAIPRNIDILTDDNGWVVEYFPRDKIRVYMSIFTRLIFLLWILIRDSSVVGTSFLHTLFKLHPRYSFVGYNTRKLFLKNFRRFLSSSIKQPRSNFNFIYHMCLEVPFFLFVVFYHELQITRLHSTKTYK